MRSRRTITCLAVAGVLAVLASGCTTTVDGRGDAAGSSAASGTPSGSGSASLPSEARARFADCRDDFNLDVLSFPAGRKAQLSIDCATVEVPLDYAKPSGRSIELQLVRVHSSDGGSGKRSLLMNPGGPGASGIDLAVSLSAQMSDNVLRSFDLVGFDPRGVGQSTPIRCLSDAQKDVLNAASPDVRTSTGFAEAKADAARVASACRARYGSALAQFDTVNTARDMDRIRQAVGDTSMNYLGFSYGTELGAQYARLFPKQVRTLVLDGAVDPSTNDITSFADQLKGFEAAFDQFAAYCVTTAPCSQLPDPRKVVYALAAQADRTPIPGTTDGEQRTATSSLVYLGVLQALYSKSLWPTLGQALQQARAGDSSGLLQLADRYNERVAGHYTNLSDANTTISCNDSPVGPSDATVRATTASWVKRFPMFGLWSAASLFTCQSWQPVRNPPPLPHANTARTVLVVGNVNDPATPYQGAKDLTGTLGNARLLTWVGQGHTSYLQGSSCVDGYVNDYLVKGTVPAEGTTCRT